MDDNRLLDVARRVVHRAALSLAALDDPGIGWSAEGLAHAVSMNWHRQRRTGPPFDELTDQ